MTALPPPLTIEAANVLADDLIRQLADHIGDPDAISDTLLRWADTLGPERLALVCMAALQTTFRDCITEVPIADVPPGAHAFTYGRSA